MDMKMRYRDFPILIIYSFFWSWQLRWRPVVSKCLSGGRQSQTRMYFQWRVESREWFTSYWKGWWATGSSWGSKYSWRYWWARACSTVRRLVGSNADKFSLEKGYFRTISLKKKHGNFHLRMRDSNVFSLTWDVNLSFRNKPNNLLRMSSSLKVCQC